MDSRWLKSRVITSLSHRCRVPGSALQGRRWKHFGVWAAVGILERRSARSWPSAEEARGAADVRDGLCCPSTFCPWESQLDCVLSFRLVSVRDAWATDRCLTSGGVKSDIESAILRSYIWINPFSTGCLDLLYWLNSYVCSYCECCIDNQYMHIKFVLQRYLI